MKFFKESIRNLKVSGSLTPSSKHLIKKCLCGVDFKSSKVILEFGVGDGCITAEILKKVSTDCRVVAIEINENLYDYGLAKFGSHPNLSLHLASAFDFDKILQAAGIQQVDYIISSLPLSLFQQQEIEILFNKIPHYLSPNGAFVQYQYSIGKYAYLKKIFKKVNVDFTIMNAPPALIFTCVNL